MTLTALLSLVLLISTLHFVSCQVCPSLAPPCTCTSSVYEPVTIICSGAGSLDEVLRSLVAAQNGRIDRLVIDDTPISRLRPFSFEGYEIGALTLNKNGLTEIDPAAFDGKTNESMTELNLDSNMLGAGLFSGSSFSRPNSGGGIARLKNLRKLFLRDNTISVLPDRAFANYESASVLEKLVFADNQLADLNPATLEGLSNLKEISFETNRFADIPSSGLRPVRQTLVDLNLGLNKLTEVPLNQLDFPNLASLSLEFNSIPRIQPEAFRGIPNLLFLYIGGNSFSRFDPNLYRYVPKLEILGIGDTNIQTIPRDAFKFTPRLRQLEMSDAAVNRIDEGAFQRIRSSIQRIVLNKNELTRWVSENVLGWKCRMLQ